MISARNKFQGTIKAMNVDQVMAELVISVGDMEIVSLISRTSARKMELKLGDQVTAIIKSTEVMIEKK
ncbi:molybdopterin-binding protein [Chloroflexota bacterium]